LFICLFGIYKYNICAARAAADGYSSDEERLDLRQRPRATPRFSVTPTDLQRAMTGDKNLVDANLEGANLEGADLSRADLTRANLNGAILNKANLSGAILNGTVLANAKIQHADFSGSIISNVVLSQNGQGKST